ncbi:hypothetical protein quinque_006813 [Culex quinquefasciatus]
MSHYFLPGVLSCVLLAIGVLGQTFVDDPPPDYFKRSSLDDCVQRFHYNTSQPFTSVHNGDPVAPGEYKAFASIGWTRSTSRVDYLCGGTLITLSYVLTAAHCSVDGENKRPDTVRLGDVDLSTNVGDQNAQQIPIKRFVRHPEYKAARAYHDIALIELEKAADPSDFVCRACLWTLPDIGYDRLTVMGFGSTDFGSDLSKMLLKADLMPLSKSDCQERFPPNRKISEGILDSQFCAADPTKDSCAGDSGGPLLVDLVDSGNIGATYKKVSFVAGVVSLGTGCNDGSLGIYTRVSSYLTWIESTTGATFNITECPRNVECRLHYPDVESKIVSQNVDPKFRVKLLQQEQSESSFCSGTLIDYRHVITSAECGLLQPKFIDLQGNVVAITKVTIHNDFNAKTLQNNLALLTLAQFLSREATDKAYYLPACPWKKETLPQGEDIYVSGVEQFGYREDYLFINATLVNDTRCPKGSLCTENPQDIVPGICKLDQGGPVTNYVRSRFDKFVPSIYAVNSRGSGCSGKGNIFEATPLAAHYKWIESQILSHVVDTLNSQQTWNQQEFYENSTCLPPTGGLGRCVPDGRCRQLIIDNRHQLSNIKICKFDGQTSIVCCPNSYL